ncbi:MAG TPA: amino acid adenylation domain-containing protein [Thermoanaerobaculia bacterium]
MSRRNVEAIYGLSPLQQGILFHTLYDAAAAEYFEQLAFPLEGRLDPQALERAWRTVVDRHPVLRTVFVWEGLDQPQQVVYRQVELPIEHHDWSDLAAAAQEQRLAALLAEDRRRGFDLRAPLLRVILIRLGGARHQLVWSHHHLLLDGWSVSLVLGEVFALYRAFAAGMEEPPLPKRRPFRDYVQWLGRQDRAAAEAFWRADFAGFVPPPPLVNGRRPATADLPAEASYGRASRRLTPADTAALRQVAALGDLTLNTVVQGAWALLLANYHDRPDVVFGVTSSGRPPDLEGAEAMVGLFVSTLPVRLRGAWREPLRPWLARLQEHNARLRQFEHSSLVDVHEWSGVPRGHGLFESILAFENYPVDKAAAAGEEELRIAGLTSIWERTNYPLTVQVLPGAELAVNLLYDRRAFAPSAAARILAHFERLLLGIGRDPSRRLGELPLVDPAAAHQTLREWNDGAAVPPGDTLLHGLFEAWATRTPAAIALVCDEESWTYAELDRRANRLARLLRDAGAGPETRVAVCLDRSLELVAAILAVLKAGGAYVPLDPAYPDKRLRFLVADAAAPLVLAAGRRATELAAEGLRVIDLETLDLARGDAAAPALDLSPDHLAYVIYTSGSTGEPKGARVTHRHVARLLRSTEAWFGFGPHDVWTLFHSFAFDFSVWEIWGALAYGGRLTVVPYGVSRAPDAFLALLARQGVTVLNQTPSAFRQLIAALPHEAPELRLRSVIFGGEALERGSLRPWIERFGDGGDGRGPRLVNMYGITETTVHVTYEPVAAAELDGERRHAVGRPIPDLDVHLLGPGGAPRPIGVAGEVFVGGAGVAQGYLGRPGLTAERFVPDPWSGRPGARLYRAGDRAVRLPDGSLAFRGRVDHQIKIRGFRVEPGEIESVLEAHPAVRRALVRALPGPGGEAVLTAYVLPRADAGEGLASAPGERVEAWREVFDETYGATPSEGDAAFHVAGWNSSYTGKPIPAEEMREWVETTVGRILALGPGGTPPRRLLEIGCGTGLLLYRVAPHCERYVATDLSPRALATIEPQLASRGLGHVSLARRPADDFDGLDEGPFDAVVLNSVVQYFPGVEYLLRVLEGAAQRLAPGGGIFVGDVRSLPLQESFHASVVRHGAAPDLSTAQLRQRCLARLAREEELVLAPSFFTAVARRSPRLARAEAHVKRGRSGNEMVRFRYDAVLRAPAPGGAEPRAAVPERVTALGPLSRALDVACPLVLADDLANARLTEDPDAGEEPVDPEELFALGREKGYEVEVGWSGGGEGGRLRAVFRRPETPRRGELLEPPEPAAALEDLASRPLRGAFVRRLGPELRRHAARELPEHMVPGAFVVLGEVPLTAHGKVDLAALPPPEDGRQAAAAAYAAPRTPTEERLAAIWSAVLGVGRVGIDDDFFDLGGHSLLATQLIAKTRKAFRSDVGLRALFDAPTVAGLAAAIDLAAARRAERGTAAATPALVPCPEERFEPFPLTEIQQAYWVGRRADMALGRVAAHVYLEVEGELDVGRVERAWRRLVERHDMLRAIVGDDGRQRVLAEVEPYTIEVLDLAGQPPEEAGARLLEVRERMSHQVLPADRWPLFELRASRLPTGRTRFHTSLDVLLFDGWSFGLLASELARLYADPDAPLPPIDVTFRDYVLTEEELRRSELYERSLEYWRARLDELPPAPELPLARRPEALAEQRFERFSGRLEAADWSRLERGARAAGLTGSAVLLAAYAEVLARFSKSPRFTINLTLFNRLPFHPHVDRILGDFTSLTLLAVDASRPEPFTVRARRLQERLWTDLDHRVVGGVRVMRELGARRGGRGAAMPVVFTSTVNLDETRAASAEGTAREGPALDLVYSIGQTPQVWLDHQVTVRGGALRYNWDGVRELFEPGFLAGMFEVYEGLLRRLAAGAEAWETTSREALLPSAQAELFAAANATAALVPEGLLHAPVAERAREAGSRPAVVAAGRSISYAELDRLAAGVERRLRELRVRPDSLVAVAAEKGWQQVAAVLGVLRSGGAYLPVDPGLPAERFAHLLRHGEVRLALTESRLVGELPWIDGVAPLAIEEIAESDPAADGDAASPQDLAYVIFTSGSTGLPKGVMIDHRGALNTVVDVNRRFDVDPEDKVLALSALNFDLSVYDIFGVLAAGGTVVVPEPWALRDPSHWWELMVREGVTLWSSVPALLEMLVVYLEGRGERLPESLRLVLLSGDWIPLDLPGRVRRLAPNARVVSLGGATEASIWSILHPIDEVDPSWASIPYGRPMLNQTFHVLDAGLERRPVGVPGELYIGGVGVARGYWRDEERTAASFLRHPRTGERLYRTGDLGRMLPTGEIEFLGREDNQVKVLGHRIELGEIEAALETHPRVRSAVAAAVGRPRGERRLVAYVVEETPAGEVEGLQLLEHKLSEPGRRRDDGRGAVALPGGAWPERVGPGGAEERRSRRRFAPRTVPLEIVGELLGALSQVRSPDEPLPRYRYASAGSLYPVQVYLHVPAGRVEGLEAGAYYHDPAAHRLVLLTPDAELPARPRDPPGFTHVAFRLYLVARLDAVSPVYGEELGRHFSALEAGLITQLLEMTAPGLGLGLCQIGEIDFPPLRPAFRLADNDRLVHSLVGGPWDGGEGEERAAAGTGLAAELGAFLRAKLPAYMVPSAFVRIDDLPLTANGKVDRAALARRAPSAEPAEPRPGGPPRSRLEEEIAGIVRDLLGRERIGVDDNFFELGGTSVHLVQAHARLRDLAGAEIPLVEMFNHPTVRSLGALLGELGPPAPAAAVPAPGPSEDGQGGESLDRRGARRRELRRLRGGEGEA